MPSNPNAGAHVWFAFTFLFVLLIAASVGIFFMPDLSELQDEAAAREGRAALQGITDSSQIEAALGEHPSNPFLQTIAMATRAANETGAAIEAVTNEIEPPALSKNSNLTTASRSELEALRRDLKTAQANAASFKPRYMTLLSTERDNVEKYASEHVARAAVIRLLDHIDKQNAEVAAFVSRMLPARVEFYRAYESYVGFLAGEFGTYKAVDGRIVFPLQQTVDRYNVVAGAMSVSGKRLDELEQERKELLKLRQEQWLEFVRSF